MTFIRKFYWLVVFLQFVVGCDFPSAPETKLANKELFTRMPSGHTGITFVNEIKDNETFNIFKYRNFYNGGGVAIGDINNDGLPDVFFTANMGKNRLYLNKGNLKFEDITESAGVGGTKPWDTGVLMVDVNSDGLLDIYVSNAGNREGNNHDNDLFINNGNLTFTERAAEFNLATSGFSTHAAFFDFDKDGDLDAYILNNSNVPVSTLGNAGDRRKKAIEWRNVPEKLRGVGHMLMRNDNGVFVDVSDKAGIFGSLMAFGLGVMVTDINEDSFPDIYVCNDFYERDYLYINNKDGTFSEEIEKWISHLCLSAMGVDIADINNDGLKDIFITDMLPETDERTKAIMEFDTYDIFELKQSRGFYQQYIQNTLQLNNGNNTFSEIAYFSGVARSDWSWSGLLFDMDNDGLKDIYVTNGLLHDLTNIDFVDFLANDVLKEIANTKDVSKTVSIINKMPSTPQLNCAFRNNGNLTFTNEALNWGLSTPSFSNGSAYGDLDNDGDVDLIVNNVNSEAFVYRNNSQSLSNNNFIQFKLEGLGNNKFCIGASVKLFVKDQIITQELQPSRGFQSSMDYIISIGLGGLAKVDSIAILWPNDSVTTLRNVAVNQRLFLKQADANLHFPPQTPRKSLALFDSVSIRMENHQEVYFDDFNQERLIVRQTSREGPAIAVGDVNNDGSSDVFIGGGKNQVAQLYLHSKNGNFQLAKNEAFLLDANLEDTAAEFFDADSDGDLDLVVGVGGNVMADKKSYVARIYFNDGFGKFSVATNLPTSNSNISVVSAADIEGDGDMDLFIGSRNVPGVYGVNPLHLILTNDGKGNFVNSTDKIAYDLKNVGMVTSARWADLQNDGKPDLVLASDWGSVYTFINNKQRLTQSSNGLDSLGGWWSALEISDLDNDGDVDLVLGNAGTNSILEPVQDSPAMMWINDFDGNGTIEQIITKRISGKDYPIHMRKEMAAQLPFLKKKNLKASDYSRKNINDLFNEPIIKNSLVKRVNYSESSVAINNGHGKFSIKALPARVQWSCVNSIVCDDVNSDGLTDIIMAGNNFGLKPQFSRQDASFGHVLLATKNFDFEWQDYQKSGVFLRNEVRQMRIVKDKQGNRFLIAVVNNEMPKVFKFNY